MAELLNDVAMRFASRASAQGVALEARRKRTARCTVAVVDIELLERALANLVDNALKFCPAAGRITLHGPGRRGQGVPGGARHRPRHRAGRRSRTCSTASTRPAVQRPPATGEGGKGLGLAIVKRIAELHGGSVEIDSREGHGTAVTIILPENP
jgi:signal transduction histidine kinase